MQTAKHRRNLALLKALWTAPLLQYTTATCVTSFLPTRAAVKVSCASTEAQDLGTSSPTKTRTRERVSWLCLAPFELSRTWYNFRQVSSKAFVVGWNTAKAHSQASEPHRIINSPLGDEIQAVCVDSAGHFQWIDCAWPLGTIAVSRKIMACLVHMVLLLGIRP